MDGWKDEFMGGYVDRQIRWVDRYIDRQINELIAQLTDK